MPNFVIIGSWWCEKDQLRIFWSEKHVAKTWTGTQTGIETGTQIGTQVFWTGIKSFNPQSFFDPQRFLAPNFVTPKVLQANVWKFQIVLTCVQKVLN